MGIPRGRVGALILSLAVPCGCAGALEDPDRFPPPTCTLRGFDVPADLFAVRCGSGDCHAAPTVAAQLDLVSPGVASRLLDAVSQGCPPRRLVDTSSPAMSYLLDKVSAVPRCGDPMPLGQLPLPEDEKACLEGWVTAVAAGSGETDS